MRLRKWITFFAVLLLLPVVLGLVLGGYVYNNQHLITNRIVAAVNESFEGELRIDKARISIFQNFPYVSIDLKGVSFYESSSQHLPPLYRFDDVYAGFNVYDLLQQNYVVKRLYFRNGFVRLHRLSDGSLNLLHAKKPRNHNNASDSGALNLNLKKIKLQNVELHYDEADSVWDVQASIRRLTTSLRTSAKEIALKVTSNLELNVWEDDVPTIFSNKQVGLSLELLYDKQRNLLTLLPSTLQLNEARFATKGTVDFAHDTSVNIHISGDKPDFSLLTAFAPAAVATTLSRYKNEGRVYFRGLINGPLAGGQTPAVDVEFGCENAWFLNAGVNKKLDALTLTGRYTNGTGRSLTTSELHLTQFSARPEEGVFEGRLFIRNFKDPFIKVDLHADLDLDFIGKFFQLQQLEHIQGKIKLDMRFDELVDLNFPASNLARLKKGIDSELSIENLSFNVPGYNLPVRNMNGHAIMRNGAITLDSIRLNIGKNDLFVSGSLSNLPALLHRQQVPVQASLRIRSKQFDVGSLFAHDSSRARRYAETITNLEGTCKLEAVAAELYRFKYLPKGTFTVEGLQATFKNYPHALKQVYATVSIDEQNLEIPVLSGLIDSSEIRATAFINNYPKWMQKNPAGKSMYRFRVQSPRLCFKDLLTYKGTNYVPEGYRNELLQQFQLDGAATLWYDNGLQRAEVQLNQLQGRMKLHPMKLEQLSGTIVWEPQKIYLHDVFGRLGGSDLYANGSWYFGSSSDIAQRTNKIQLRSNRLDLDSILGYQGPTANTNHATAYNLFELPFTDGALKIDVGQLHYHKHWLRNLHTELRMQKNHMLFVDTLYVEVAAGRIGFSGYFNGSNPQRIYLNSRLHAKEVDVEKLLIKLDNFGQDVLISDNLTGTITGTITSNLLVHPDFTPILEQSDATLDLQIVNGTLIRFAPMQAMSRFFRDRNLNRIRFDTLRNVLELKQGTLHIPNMNINSSLGFMELEGRQGLDLQMDYRMRFPLRLVTQAGWQALFGRRREEIDPDREDAIIVRDTSRSIRFLSVRLTGTPDNYNVALGSNRNRRN